MRLKLFLIIFVLLILSSCSNNKIIYPADTFVKEYFENNKNLIDVSTLEYGDYNNEYPQTAVIFENSEYLIGIRKYVRMDEDWSSVYYTPCIYGKNDKEYYKNIIEDLILNNNLFDVPIFHNRYTYYDPFNDDYKSICWIKEKSESFVVFTMIFYELPAVSGTLWLCPTIFSERFYNEIKNKTEKKKIKNIINMFYEKKSKKEIIEYFDSSFSGYFNINKLSDNVYRLKSRSTEPFDEVGSFFNQLGYTPQDIRKEMDLLGLNIDILKCSIAEIKVDLSSGEPNISFELKKME